MPTVLPTLDPLPLAPSARQTLLDLARDTDVLLVGDTHGTQEIPRLLAGLAPALAPLGYRALGLEMPPDEGAPLRAWADGVTDALPQFFADPSGDGRSSLQVLAMVRTLRRAGWEVFAFDGTAEHWKGTWASRDRGMAESFAAQFQTLPQWSKALALCGLGHARLRQSPGWGAERWPSCAANLAAMLGDRRIRSVNICFHGGTFYNGLRVRKQPPQPWPWPEAAGQAAPTPDDGYTLELHLQASTAASFVGLAGARFTPAYLLARLADTDPEGGVHRIRFGALPLAMDGRTGGVTIFLTPKRNVVCYEVGPEGDGAGGVVRVFPSVEAAGRSGRYAAALLEHAAQEEADLRDQDIQLGPGLPGKTGPDAEFLDL